MKAKILFILFFIYFTLSLPSHAYIDPGTGSLLFSVVLCSVATIFFILRTLFLNIKIKLFKKNPLSKNENKFTIYSEGKQYYAVFKPILDEFEKRNIPAVFYTSSKDDPILDENYSFIKKEYIGSGNKAYFKLAFLNSDICLMTTPQLDVLQLKRSKNVKHYSHIFHAISFSMDYRLFSLDYYDSVLCDASFQIPMIRELEEKRNLKPKALKVVGSTYMDYNKTKIKNVVENKQYTILIAPSWGQFGLLAKHGEILLDKLKNTEYKIIIRPHPQSMKVEAEKIKKLIAQTRDLKNIQWDFENDNITSLSKADMLISDFSCIMMDYAFLFKKPFLYIKTDIDFSAMDCGDLDSTPWRYKIMNVIGRELNPNNNDIENITNIIEQIKQDEQIKLKITQACNYAWEEQGSAAKNVVDFLVKTQLELEKK